MDSTRSPPPSTIQFPLNLGCAAADQAAEIAGDKGKVVVDEMDFFSDKKELGGGGGGGGDLYTTGPSSISDFNVNVNPYINFFSLQERLSILISVINELKILINYHN